MQAKKPEEKKSEEKKPQKPVTPPVVKTKEELAAEKSARYKDALQKQQELKNQKQAQKQQEQQKKQEKQQKETKIVPKPGYTDNTPMTTVTTLDEKSQHVAGTRVIDTRGAGNVDLSKYDEKLERFVDTSKKNYVGGTQKLKKQNK